MIIIYIEEGNMSSDNYLLLFDSPLGACCRLSVYVWFIIISDALIPSTAELTIPPAYPEPSPIG